MMDHAEAEKGYAVEQYLLGQLSEAEQDRFEEHFFSCHTCAEDVKAGTTFLANLKSVFAEREAVRAQQPAPNRKWWQFTWLEQSFVPAAALAACGAFACIIGYQNVLQIPGLRAQVQDGSPTMSVAAPVPVSAERAGEPLTISKSSLVASVEVAHEWEEAYSGYRIELKRQDGSIVARSDLAANKGNVVVTLRTSGFEPGRYTLSIYGVKEGQSGNTPLGRVPIVFTK
jgi:hypothetical protein